MNELSELGERFSSLPAEGFSEGERADYMARLWRLLGEQTARFTMGDSSSAPVETAAELLDSILYTLDFALEKKGLGRAALMHADLDALLREGQTLLLEEAKSVKRLYLRVKSCAVRLDNVYYRETLEKASAYFAHYDHLFFAQRVSPDLDYPLLIAAPENLRGMSYMREYFHRLNMENRILNAFEPARVERLLSAAVPEWKSAFFNMCEQTLINAAGLAVLRRDVRALDIPPDDVELLADILGSAGEDAIGGMLSGAAERLCHGLGRDESELIAYAADGLAGLRPRLESAMAAGDISRVFVSFLPEGVGAAAD